MTLPKLIYNAEKVSTIIVEQEVDQRIKLLRERFSSRGRILLRLSDRLNTIYWIFALLREQRSFAVLPMRSTAAELAGFQACTRAAYLLEDNDSVATYADSIPPAPGDFDITVFTSGSAASPKAVSLTRTALEHSAHCHERWFQLERDAAWFLCLPLEHMGGLAVVLRAYFLGTPLGLNPTTEIAALLQALRSSLYRGVSLVPTQVIALLNLMQQARVEFAPDFPYMLVGGAAVDPFLREEILRWGGELPIYPSYGMSEAGSQIATARLQDSLADRLDKKYLVGSVEATLNADNELLIRGPSLFRGYLSAGIPNAHGGEWFATGDLAQFPEPSCVRILGRAKEIVISGGINISLAEIREVAAKHAGLSNLEALGVDDPYWGQRLIAFYLTPSGTALPEQELRDFFSQNLEPAKVPKAFFHVERFPLLASGKVDQRALCARAKELLQLQ